MFFECSEEVMEERLIKRGEASGRVDDNAETIKKRFRTFMEKTVPVLESYEEKNKVKRVCEALLLACLYFFLFFFFFLHTTRMGSCPLS